MTGMTKSEREDLQRLIHQREKAMKSAAKLRSTELLADFENQLASEFRFDDDAVWAEAAKTAQAEIATAGLESDAARAFVAKLPTVESLMPTLSYEEIAGEADPPVIEQLVSPNALRQRRFRKKREALRNAQTVTPGALRNSPDNAADGGS